MATVRLARDKLIGEYLSRIREANTPEVYRSYRRPAPTSAPPADSYSAAKPLPEPVALVVHEGPPETALEAMPYCQLGSTAEICCFLGVGELQPLGGRNGEGMALNHEDKMIGATAYG